MLSQYFATSDKLIDIEDPQFQTRLLCPVSGEKVVGDRWKYPFMPSGQIIWWHCPACQGWHVMRVELNINTENIFAR